MSESYLLSSQMKEKKNKFVFNFFFSQNKKKTCENVKSI